MFSALLHFFGLVFTRCYGEYGCYSLGGNFYALARPINVFPLNPEVINVTFYLYNRYNFAGEKIFDYNNLIDLTNSSFCESCETKIIIHGFIESTVKPWVKSLAKELLKHDHYNVIIVDWRNGALPPYTQAVANARIMGAIIAKFIRNAKELFNISSDSIHLIGHSLGAHVAGYVGQEIKGIGRITGLDPAKPFFELTSPNVRLDPTDANFVDVIHTDTGLSARNLEGFGYYEPLGHADFYPNGGIIQTGCKDGLVSAMKRAQGKLTYELKEYLMCNHKRSYMYFLESINTDCPMLSSPCDSWENYTDGKCFDCESNECNRMGFHALKSNLSTIPNDLTENFNHKKYYLILGSRRPFCKHHYRITIDVESGLYGRLGFTLVGEKADSWKFVFLNKDMLYSSGAQYSYVFVDRDVGVVTDIVLQWEAVRKVFKPMSWYFWRKPVLAISRIQLTSLETGISSSYNSEAVALKHNMEYTIRMNNGFSQDTECTDHCNL
ncbi:hypothetical protein CHUAL_004718 [Chamberlinius hualienensis]